MEQLLSLLILLAVGAGALALMIGFAGIASMLAWLVLRAIGVLPK